MAFAQPRDMDIRSFIRVLALSMALLFSFPVFAQMYLAQDDGMAFIGDYDFFCFVNESEVSGCMSQERGWDSSQILQVRSGFRKKGNVSVKKIAQGQSHICALYADGQVVCQFRGNAAVKTGSLMGE